MPLSLAESPGRIPTRIRLLSLAPVGLACGFVTLVALSLTGWGFSDSLGEQLRSDAGVLVLAAVSGAMAGSSLLLSAVGRASWAVLASGAALGCLPVLIRLLAYGTDRF